VQSMMRLMDAQSGTMQLMVPSAVALAAVVAHEAAVAPAAAAAKFADQPVPGQKMCSTVAHLLVATS
jgi:uncharacterized membrane protein